MKTFRIIIQDAEDTRWVASDDTLAEMLKMNCLATVMAATRGRIPSVTIAKEERGPTDAEIRTLHREQLADFGKPCICEICTSQAGQPG